MRMDRSGRSSQRSGKQLTGEGNFGGICRMMLYHNYRVYAIDMDDNLTDLDMIIYDAKKR